MADQAVPPQILGPVTVLAELPDRSDAYSAGQPIATPDARLWIADGHGGWIEQLLESLSVTGPAIRSQRTVTKRMLRWRKYRWGRSWTFDLRGGEWWIGARRNFPCDAIEINLFGLTLMVGRG